jgi:hypothetical protein
VAVKAVDVDVKVPAPCKYRVPPPLIVRALLLVQVLCSTRLPPLRPWMVPWLLQPLSARSTISPPDVSLLIVPWLTKLTLAGPPRFGS